MKGFSFYKKFPVHWGDMDALGHVNHTKYLLWFETVRCLFFSEIGLVSTGAPTIGPILANANVNYRAPLHFPDTVDVGLRVSRIGNTSFVLSYELYRESDHNTIICDATTVVVLVDYQKNQKTPIPQAMRTKMQAFVRKES